MPTYSNIDREGEASQPICFNQNTASTTWVVNHNLGYRPLVQIFDSAGTYVLSCVTHLDDNTFTVSHNNAFSGRACFR